MALMHGLQALVAVADLGSVTAAAEELSYAPSTVSRHLRELERHVGHPLLTRCWQGSMLTPRGRSLVPIARALVCGAAQLAAGCAAGFVVGEPHCSAGADLPCAGIGGCPGIR